ncbi:hypothetical protein MHBO_002526 [Bonamia ostreae]|uniref:Uncharacterized protein n=1 Tax=Bonamia ostreae TaxID=126728 RepID=A0ABV2AMM0_9EUKA
METFVARKPKSVFQFDAKLGPTEYAPPPPTPPRNQTAKLNQKPLKKYSRLHKFIVTKEKMDKIALKLNKWESDIRGKTPSRMNKKHLFVCKTLLDLIIKTKKELLFTKKLSPSLLNSLKKINNWMTIFNSATKNSEADENEPTPNHVKIGSDKLVFLNAENRFPEKSGKKCGEKLQNEIDFLEKCGLKFRIKNVKDDLTVLSLFEYPISRRIAECPILKLKVGKPNSKNIKFGSIEFSEKTDFPTSFKRKLEFVFRREYSNASKFDLFEISMAFSRLVEKCYRYKLFRDI